MSRHRPADRHAFGFRGGDDVVDPAARHDRDAVGELEDFVEILGDEEDRGATVALLHDLRPDLGDRGEVEAEAGVGDDQHVDRTADSSRASTARCTLPPERFSISSSVEGVFTR